MQIQLRTACACVRGLAGEIGSYPAVIYNDTVARPCLYPRTIMVPHGAPLTAGLLQAVALSNKFSCVAERILKRAPRVSVLCNSGLTPVSINATTFGFPNGFCHIFHLRYERAQSGLQGYQQEDSFSDASDSERWTDCSSVWSHDDERYDLSQC